MKIYYERLKTDKQTFYFASDVHFGHKNCDLNIFVKELEEAKKRNARIIIIGDLFDSIFPYGDKRWNPTVLIPELQQRDDAPVYATSMMAKILKPFAKHIDLLGMGNHEYSVLKYHGTDMINLLIMQMNQSLNGHKIWYGGYTGYLGYRFQFHDVGCRKVLKILYHHGGGGSAPVTKGMIDVNRKETNWSFDIFVFGHKHHTFGVRDIVINPIFRAKGEGYIIATDTRAIQTGAFYRNYPETHSMDLPTYEEKMNLPPKPIGGVFVNVQLKRQWIPQLKTDTTYFKIRCEI